MDSFATIRERKSRVELDLAKLSLGTTSPVRKNYIAFVFHDCRGGSIKSLHHFADLRPRKRTLICICTIDTMCVVLEGKYDVSW